MDVLSAAWLHAGVLHILFNMMWVRDLAPATARLYGPGRAVIIYTVAAITGFAASRLAFRAVPAALPVRSGFTVGASAPIFGLVGALLYYGRRGGSSHIGQQAKSLAIIMAIFGFIIPGIDNWAHLGGLGGGWLAARCSTPSSPSAAITCWWPFLPRAVALVGRLLGGVRSRAVPLVIHSTH